MLASPLASDTRLHGESFNFGPRSEQNTRVVDLLRDLAAVWGHTDPSASYKLTGDVPFHEAGLLKLSCDKALLALRWEPNLSYDECVELTGSWYRAVLKEDADAGEVTAAQIRRYEDVACQRHRVWCQAEQPSWAA